MFIIIGIIATAFGVNEVVSSFTGENFLKDWMGEDLYKGLYIGFTLAATIASIAGNIYLRNLAKQAKLGTGESYTGDPAKDAKNYRNNLKEFTKQTGDGKDAHHVFPKSIKDFDKFDINVNHPENMQWVDSALHSGVGNRSAEYTRIWKEFLDSSADLSKSDIVEFGKAMSKFFG